jgi:hypothetical protein
MLARVTLDSGSVDGSLACAFGAWRAIYRSIFTRTRFQVPYGRSTDVAHARSAHRRAAHAWW